MSSRSKRWASPISTVMVGIPALVASVRSMPSEPSLSMTTLEPNAFASRETASSLMSARTWNMFVRPRVDVWKSSPKSQGRTKFSKTVAATRRALVDPFFPGNARLRSRS